MMEIVEVKNLEEFLQNRIDGQIVNKKITRLTAPGENNCSLMLKLDLEVQKNGTKDTVHTVAKCLPPSEHFRKMLGFMMLNEIHWYSEVTKLFKNFQKECGYKEVADFFPEMIAARLSLDPSLKDDVDMDAVLVLENLVYKGYKNEDRYVGFSLEQSKTILKRLATFAAVFIGLKLKKPKVYAAKIKSYLTHQPPPPPPPKKENNDEMKYLLRAFEDDPEGVAYVDRMKELLGKKPFLMNKGSTPEPWRTVGHGDFWVNNIMIRSEGEEETKVKFVDFQVCNCEKSYASDLVFFLLSSVQSAVQKEHFENLIRFYYDEFIKNLKMLSLDLSLPYDEYLEELKRVAKEGELNHAIFFCTVIFGPKNSEYDSITDPNFNPGNHFSSILKNMNQHHKDKLVLIANLAGKMGWI